MAVIYHDQEIDAMIKEPKSAPPDWHDQIHHLKTKRNHSEQQVDIIGYNGNNYRLILSQNLVNRLNFSIILAVRLPQSNVLFRLLRYNGSHEHTNHIERTKFDDFHIHKATERYQKKEGPKEDGYAEPTDRYSDLRGALKCLINDANIEIPKDSQGNLFEE